MNPKKVNETCILETGTKFDVEAQLLRSQWRPELEVKAFVGGS